MIIRPGEYEKRKEQTRERNRRQSVSGRNIGELPSIADPTRRRDCSHSFKLHCEQYHEHTFFLRWSNDHLKVIEQIEESVLRGGLFATAMPRASGKTSLSSAAVEWSVLNGFHEFVALIGSNEAI